MDALSRASDSTIRAILTALCDNSAVRSKALKLLQMLEPKAITTAGNPITKLKATSGLSICVQCGEPFDENDNTTKDCHYHSGKSGAPSLA